tara:strand:- start:333 stop:536 length:204 start_codon:yes stop_codon:yes gene_type:complete
MFIVQNKNNKLKNLRAALATAKYGKKQSLFLQFVIRYNLVDCANWGWYLPVGQNDEANCKHTSQNKE